MLRSRHFFFLSGLILCGCSKPKSPSIQPQQLFDFKAFFAHEMDSLHQLNFSLNKTITWQDKVESVELDKPDWEKELKLFAEFNPNVPALVDVYTCDTLISPSGEMEITLTANNKKPFCRMARINISKKGHVNLIEMMMEKRSSFSRMNYTLGYQPMKGFAIQGESFGIGESNFKMDVLGEFRNIRLGY